MMANLICQCQYCMESLFPYISWHPGLIWYDIVIKLVICYAVASYADSAYSYYF